MLFFQKEKNNMNDLEFQRLKFELSTVWATYDLTCPIEITMIKTLSRQTLFGIYTKIITETHAHDQSFSKEIQVPQTWWDHLKETWNRHHKRQLSVKYTTHTLTVKTDIKEMFLYPKYPQIIPDLGPFYRQVYVDFLVDGKDPYE